MKKSTLLGIAHWATFGVGTIIISATTGTIGANIVTKNQPPLIVSTVVGAAVVATNYAMVCIFDKMVVEPIHTAQINAEAKEALHEFNEKKMKN